MALDNKRSVYEIAIEIGGKLKQSLGTATSGANKKLSGLAVYADKTARATTSLSKAINGMMLVKGVSWVSGHMISIGKSAIAAASEMETYRTTLNTVLRDEEKAADMMRWSTEFAAHTPYNTGDIVDAVTRLEAYGFKSQVMLENIGNMAYAMNKDLPTAVEAVYKATLGEMELMENNFAITKKLINEKAQEWYGQAVIDASKKITDTEMYTNTLLRLIEEKFEGGMEAQSKMWAGIKSNMEDSWDAISRRIVGMDAAGEATERGLYARMLRMGQRAADSLSAFADSDMLDKWAAKIGNFIDTDGAKFADWLKQQGKVLGDSIADIADIGWLWEGVETIFNASIERIRMHFENANNFINAVTSFTDLFEGDKKSFKDAWGKWWNGLFENNSVALNLDIIKDMANKNEPITQPIRSIPMQSSTLYQISVTAKGESAGADTIAKQVADAVAERINAIESAKEAAHQTARVSLRPNKMQTAY